MSKADDAVRRAIERSKKLRKNINLTPDMAKDPVRIAMQKILARREERASEYITRKRKEGEK